MKRFRESLLVVLLCLFPIGLGKVVAGLDSPQQPLTMAGLSAIMGFTPTPSKSVVVYTSSAADATVTAANTRLSMLPADVKTGNAYISIPANALPIGAHIYLTGTGTIGARLTTPPGFNFIPWVRPPSGSKTDLPGFSMAPLLGTDGTCEVWMKITQTSAGLRVSGYVRYGAVNGQAYSVALNPGGTGASGALPTIIPSDPTVDREIGVDGFWGTGSDTREYVRARSVTALLNQP